MGGEPALRGAASDGMKVICIEFSFKEAKQKGFFWVMFIYSVFPRQILTFRQWRDFSNTWKRPI
jgi:hypothetical protein